MSHSTSLTISAGPHSQGANGETLWRWIGWAFAAYWALFASSAFTGQKELNTVGGLFVLATLGWGILERLWVKIDAVVLVSLAAMMLPLVHVFLGDGTQSGQAIFKHVSLCAVMAISRVLRLPVASRSNLRWLLAVPVLVILAICLFVDRGAAPDAARRAGLFVNPNNLALIPFLLLFLIDEARDPLAVKLGIHAIVVAVLVFSGTSGAIIAYAIGLAVHLRSRLSAVWRPLAIAGVLAGTSLAACLFIIEGESLLPETRLTKQVALMRTQFENVLQGGQVAYYDEERLLGTGATSAVWRLAHWRHTVIKYLEGTPAQYLFGFGIGSSPLLLPNFPHNEYLRVLFEQGIAGLILFLFVWRRIIMTASPSVRYIGLIVAIYSFSENNLDNFPFMSLLVLFLSATELAIRPKPVQATWRESEYPVIRSHRHNEVALSGDTQ